MRNLIQEQLNKDIYTNSLKSAVRDLYNKYTIEHAIFGLNEKFEPCEIANGYFETIEEYDNLDECLQNIKEVNECVFIESSYTKDESGKRTLNEKFTIGTFKPVLSECDNTKKILDTSTLETICIDEGLDNSQIKKFN